MHTSMRNAATPLRGTGRMCRSQSNRSTRHTGRHEQSRAQAAMLEGRFPQLEGALIPEIVGVGLTRWSYLGFAVELDSHVWCSRYLIQTYYHVISSADRATIMISEPLPPLNDQAAGAILIECFKPHHLSQVSSCTRAATTFFTPLGNG